MRRCEGTQDLARDSLNWAESRLKVRKGGFMLWTIFVILLILWVLGLVSSYTFGGFIHILLVIAVVILIINLVSGRRAV